MNHHEFYRYTSVQCLRRQRQPRWEAPRLAATDRPILTSQLPDLYRLPPTDTQSIDDWQPPPPAEDDELEIPEPDYDEQLPPPPPEDELIAPKKLVNPVLDSRERQDLHREMLMNKKMGVDVLRRKSELKKELERRAEQQKRRELEEQYRLKRSSFEQKLEEQANKLKTVEQQQHQQQAKSIEEEPSQPEFLRVHSKIIKNATH